MMQWPVGGGTSRLPVEGQLWFRLWFGMEQGWGWRLGLSDVEELKVIRVIRNS